MTKRMKHPMDTFTKRQFTYMGETAHEFHNLPGKYLNAESNEYPSVDGSIPRADVVYSVEMDDKSIVNINVEDETTSVNEETLHKCKRYQVNITYKNQRPVISVITTTLALNKCLKKLNYSITDKFTPIIKSLPYSDAWQRLNTLIDKANKQENFTRIEGLELINMPRLCMKNQYLAVEKITSVLLNLKVDDDYFKNELIYSFQCMIHKYAKTETDIERLERLIGMKTIIHERNEVLDHMKRQGELEGMKNGIIIGKQEGMALGKEAGIKDKFKMALKLKNFLSIDEIVAISGFSREELENEKLNDYDSK